jgi:hypothetical protein
MFIVHPILDGIRIYLIRRLIQYCVPQISASWNTNATNGCQHYL